MSEEHKIDPIIHVESLVSHLTRKPIVRIQWGPMEGKLTPAEARAHAQAITEVAFAAELYAFVIHWLTNVIGADIEKALMVLRDFREWRKTQEIIS